METNQTMNIIQPKKLIISADGVVTIDGQLITIEPKTALLIAATCAALGGGRNYDLYVDKLLALEQGVLGGSGK